MPVLHKMFQFRTSILDGPFETPVSSQLILNKYFRRRKPSPVPVGCDCQIASILPEERWAGKSIRRWRDKQSLSHPPEVLLSGLLRRLE